MITVNAPSRAQKIATQQNEAIAQVMAKLNQALTGLEQEDRKPVYAALIEKLETRLASTRRIPNKRRKFIPLRKEYGPWY